MFGRGTDFRQPSFLFFFFFFFFFFGGLGGPFLFFAPVQHFVGWKTWAESIKVGSLKKKGEKNLKAKKFLGEKLGEWLFWIERNDASMKFLVHCWRVRTRSRRR